MEKRGVLLVGATAAIMAGGCECSPSNPGTCGGPVETRPTECDLSCVSGEMCPIGFYCDSLGACTADCVSGDPSHGCPESFVCNRSGQCVPNRTIADAEVPFLDGAGCAHVSVEARPITPNVILIVDQSGSMTASFSGSTRWLSLRSSLLSNPGGLIADLQSRVRFGLALYSAEADGNTSSPVAGTCPLITWVPPTIENYDAIDRVYRPAAPIDETPTGESLDAVIDLLRMTPDPSTDPTIFVLATDGEPDTCGQPNPQQGQPQALAAARRAFGMGIRTYIISVGQGVVSEAHLRDMANAGLGRVAGEPDAAFWVAGDDAGLRDALSTIIAGELSCTIELNGRIQNLDQACLGSVRMQVPGATAERELTCDDANGWHAIDATHIELVGDACDTLLEVPGVRLMASFPCEIILF